MALSSRQFKKCGHELVDWAVNYMTTLEEKYLPLPAVAPGWLWNVCPKEPPQKADSFEKLIKDLEPVVLEGMAHWQHRQFFSYFPSGNSWASIMGDIFANSTAANGTNWCACPVVSELEHIICDWMCKFLGLPTFFLSKYTCPESEGTGVIQHSASEAIFFSMVFAREDCLKKLRKKYPDKPRAVLLNMMVCYCNGECHSCVQRASLMGVCHLKKLNPDNEGKITAATLRKNIKEDLANGLVPFFHVAIIGSTGITSSDDLMEVGPVCEEYGLWLHCDSAYAGASFACQEMRHVMMGYEYVWSTNCNTNKWMMCNFEASLQWLRYASKAFGPMTGYDENLVKGRTLPNFKHYAMPGTRRFRAIKLWMVIRNYGVEGLRRYCRRHINLAKLFTMYLKRDGRFEVCNPVRFGLVSFRVKGLNLVTSRILEALNYSRKIHMVPSHFHDKYVIRFAMCAEHADEKDIDDAWRIIDEYTSVILREYEREHFAKEAMRPLYEKQHLHDEIQALHKDELILMEEEEARKIVHELDVDHKKECCLLKALKTLAMDGGWDTSDSNAMERFDEYLLSNPHLTVDHIWKDPDCHEKVSSMLHLLTLEETATHHPDVVRKLTHLAELPLSPRTG